MTDESIAERRRVGLRLFLLGFVGFAINHVVCTAFPVGLISLCFLWIGPVGMVFGLILLIAPTLLYTETGQAESRPIPKQIPMAILLGVGLLISALLARFYHLF